MFEKNAIETVGKETLLIKDGKVVGEVSVISVVGMVCGVIMKDDPCQDLVKDTVQLEIWLRSQNEQVAKQPYRYAFFHFNIITGEYIGEHITQSEFREKETALDGCFIVDKFNFDYGWCSNTFSTVEGFGNKMKQ